MDDEFDIAHEEMYARLADELYPEHKEQAVQEFAVDRLRSYYLANPNVAKPAVFMLRNAEQLFQLQQHEAALVFAVSSIELFLKATLLKPVIYGLIHSEAVAEVIVNETLSQSGLKRYHKLLGKLFNHLTESKLEEIKREGESSTLLKEIEALQEKRNKVVHQGFHADRTEANQALNVAHAVVSSVLSEVLWSLGLEARKGEGICVAR
ncbi:hypothetical protein [Nitrosomonas oligotropha]|uniref:hypothetical protein n=1 Tax=Nitrosomonas oligotropha TaxID=42354 RepID=UPI00136B35B7|nr:hypothetical protein [Nitrosomonas oligotropha]MXS83715.1 hypothetical protein [Nitrosomonas oligotropha]